MSVDVIRVVWGSATQPTKMAAYDAALADAGIENYNLVTVSSVIPADATVEAVGTAPDLGPVGDRLTVVQAYGTLEGEGSASASLAWAQSEGGTGPGLFYEFGGAVEPETAHTRALEGLEAGQSLREWDFGLEEASVRTESATGDGRGWTAAVVAAVYGESESMF